MYKYCTGNLLLILFGTVAYIRKTRTYNTVQNANNKYKICEPKNKRNRGASKLSVYRKRQNGPKGLEIHKNGPARVKEETKSGLKRIIWMLYVYGVMVVLYRGTLPLILVICSNL